MKTNEEKLKKLLEVAKTNDWNKITYEIQSIQIKDYFVQFGTWSGDYYWFSLNDLVTNFEEGEVSFIEALCKTIYSQTFLPYDYIGLHKNPIEEQYDRVFRMKDSFLDFSQQVRLHWIMLPTSQRLPFLFDTFNHLIQ